jgi:hypothetical protein
VSMVSFDFHLIRSSVHYLCSRSVFHLLYLQQYQYDHFDRKLVSSGLSCLTDKVSLPYYSRNFWSTCLLADPQKCQN